MPSISVDRLQPGVFVTLEGVAWLDHPFLLNSFRISSEKQIEVLRQMGVQSIAWHPARSTAGPLPEKRAPKPVEPDFGAGALQAMMEHKRQRAAQVEDQRTKFTRCERLFEQETGTVSLVLRDIHSMPNESFARARATVDRLAGRLAGAKIPRIARVVAVANRYDNLCNPFELAQAKTPAEAVAQMFRQEAGAFDPEVLQAFVRSLGVYPPGSFVALSDGSTGLVVESSPADSLRPTVMVYDEHVPRSEALLVDLREAELAVEGAVNPARLPVAVVEYLAPRGRIDYYIDAN